MSEIICRSISNGREFEVPNDYFRSLHALRSECNSYIPAEARYTELLEEHDKQVREEVLDEVFSEIDKLTVYYAGDNVGNAITPKMLVKEDVVKLLEQLKEQSNETI